MNRYQISDSLKISVARIRYISKFYKVPIDFDSIASVLYLKAAGLKPREIKRGLKHNDK